MATAGALLLVTFSVSNAQLRATPAGSDPSHRLIQSQCAEKLLGNVAVATVALVPFVTLKANGHPITLLLDTGAERTTLTPSAAHRIEARPPRVLFDRQMRGVAGSMQSQEIEFDSLSADGVPIPWRRALVAPVTLAAPFGLPLDGLLGADILDQFDVDIDFARGKLSLYPKGSCTNVPPWSSPYSTFETGLSRAEHLFFRIGLNDKEVVAIADTGAQRTTVSTATAHAVGITDAALTHDETMTTRGATAEEILSHVHRFSELRVGSEILRQPELVVANVQLRDADIVLGMDFLKSRRIWLDYDARQIFLSRAESE